MIRWVPKFGLPPGTVPVSLTQVALTRLRLVLNPQDGGANRMSSPHVTFNKGVEWFFPNAACLFSLVLTHKFSPSCNAEQRTFDMLFWHRSAKSSWPLGRSSPAFSCLYFIHFPQLIPVMLALAEIRHVTWRESLPRLLHQAFSLNCACFSLIAGVYDLVSAGFVDYLYI
ncbi:hypothetical protein AMATHDRAFT_60764 [Amanita thiersii Skay4041]|uniref:Uncharacterized protein n=1 Tax=Amanita thiersii Skay4041 TaxID=703135 RepID=A0A2A9NQU2_9AGAR|nr:hypothetical protein AMATHDRAFT_60764 [Amanita thiersii Skay4041]